MSFPTNGLVPGETKYTLGNTQYTWNGVAWDVFGAISGNALADAQAETATKNSTFGVDTGVVNAVQIDNVDYEVLFDGMVVMFTPANANTGATTLKVKTLTSKPLFYNGADLVAGYLNTTSKYIAVYDLANDRFDVDVITGGSTEQRFTVADAVNADEAVSKTQLDLKANTADLKEIGVGQVWVDETANRAAGVTYTNTFGRPIVIFPRYINIATAGGLGIIITVDNEVFNCLVPGASLASNNSGTGTSLIIPAGSQYKVDTISCTIEHWAELK